MLIAETLSKLMKVKFQNQLIQKQTPLESIFYRDCFINKVECHSPDISVLKILIKNQYCES
jgi:hypothetical protein